VGARYSAHVQTGPEVQASSSRSSGVKRSGRCVDHPTSSSVEVRERVELYRFSLSGTSWPTMGLTLPYLHITVKTIPLQAWTDPEGSRRMSLPDVKTIGI
jgi:hypothetical protein